MKTAIKHNLLLLSRMSPIIMVLAILLITLFIFEGAGFFIITIPIITFFSIFTLESYDGKKYNTLFSVPITKTEFAKAKFYTLLIVIGAASLLILILYFICVYAGITELNVLHLILELAITLPLSVFVGGILVGIEIDYVVTIALLYILIMNFSILNINGADVELQIGKDKILDTMILITWLGLSIASYIGTKRSIIGKYNDMEL